MTKAKHTTPGYGAGFDRLPRRAAPDHFARWYAQTSRLAARP